MAQSGEDENNFSPQPSHPQALIYVSDWYLLGVKLSLSHTQIGTFYVGVPPPGLFVRLSSYKDLQTGCSCLFKVCWNKSSMALYWSICPASKNQNQNTASNEHVPKSNKYARSRTNQNYRNLVCLFSFPGQ